MPHLVLEHSSNLVEKKTLVELFEKCHGLLTEKLPTERKSCVSRAIECQQYYIGEGQSDLAFIHVTLKVKAGRTFDVLKETAEALLAAIKAHCTASVNQLNLKVTLEIIELQKTYFS